jgi:hypothetical protein
VLVSENIGSGRLLTDPVKLVAVTFMQEAVAASQSNVQLTVAQVDSAANNAVDGITMPWAGCIVGVSYSLSAAASAGTLTIGPTVDGTEETDPTLSVTTGTSGSDTAKRGVATFDAGAQIGAEITTDGSWNATTADLAVTVWCLVEVTGV